MKKPSRKILIYILVGALVLICVYLGYAYGKNTFPFGPEKWQAVRLISGDVYYGHLKTFPCCKLKDAYFVQKVQTGTSAVSKLMPLSAMFFTPENVLYLNKSQILWWADLNENSEILKAIKESK